MRPQLEPVLESHLAAILMGELLRRHEDLDDTYVDIVLDDLDLDTSDEYASFELIQVPISESVVEAVATTEFVRVRDTSHDHVTTERYPRPSLDLDTQPVPLYSAPYERIDIRPLPTAEHERIDIRPSPTAELERIDVRPRLTSEARSERIAIQDVDDEPNIPVYVETSDSERIDIRALPTGETTLDGEQPIVPLYSTPYDPTEEPTEGPTEEPVLQFAVGSAALPLPLYSVPYERVDLDVRDCSRPFVKAAPTVWSFESTEIVSAPNRTSRVIATIVVFVGATLLGLSIALYAI